MRTREETNQNVDGTCVKVNGRDVEYLLTGVLSSFSTRAVHVAGFEARMEYWIRADRDSRIRICNL
jgi:hypothetical protein